MRYMLILILSLSSPLGPDVPAETSQVGGSVEFHSLDHCEEQGDKFIESFPEDQMAVAKLSYMCVPIVESAHTASF